MLTGVVRMLLGFLIAMSILTLRACATGLGMLLFLALPCTGQVERLRCEYLSDPQGIGVTVPRLGWIISSKRRGEKQTAYQVLVSSSRNLLDNDQGDLWDSEKVCSDESAHISYAGRALSSRQDCFWKVRVWDREGRPSGWSKAAHWQMGLLDPKDWKAKWITAPGAFWWKWIRLLEATQLARRGLRALRAGGFA